MNEDTNPAVTIDPELNKGGGDPYEERLSSSQNSMKRVR